MRKGTMVVALLSTIAISLTFAADPPKLPFTVSKETTVVTSPLHDDGTPDYVAALNEKYGKGVTPENNSFVAWLQVVGTGDDVLSPNQRDAILKMAGAAIIPAGGDHLQVFRTYLGAQGIQDPELTKLDDEFDTLWHSLWKAADHPQAAAFLKAQENVLDRATAASERSTWWVPAVSADGSASAVLVPSLGQVRNAANLLAARAALRAADGDFEGFKKDILAIKRLARLIGRGPTLIDRLVGVAIDSLADQPLGAAVGKGTLTEAQCRQLDEELRALPPMPPVVDSLDTSERWIQLDMLVTIASGKGSPLTDNAMQPNEARFMRALAALPPDAINWDGVFRQVNERMDRTVAAAKAPTLQQVRKDSGAVEAEIEQWGKDRDQADFERQAGESRDDYSVRIARGFISIISPTFDRAEELYRRDALQTQMGHLLLAAGQVRAKTGKWPAALRDLAPEWVKEVPRDLYPVDAPGELKLQATDEGGRIISVGDGRTISVGIYAPPAPSPSALDGLP